MWWKTQHFVAHTYSIFRVLALLLLFVLKPYVNAARWFSPWQTCGGSVTDRRCLSLCRCEREVIISQKYHITHTTHKLALSIAKREPDRLAVSVIQTSFISTANSAVETFMCLDWFHVAHRLVWQISVSSRLAVMWLKATRKERNWCVLGVEVCYPLLSASERCIQMHCSHEASCFSVAW